jgi:hypothetical protein
MEWAMGTHNHKVMYMVRKSTVWGFRQVDKTLLMLRMGALYFLLMTTRYQILSVAEQLASDE